MTFEDLVTRVTRCRPDHDDWQEHLCHAVLGLYAEATCVLSWCLRCGASGTLPSADQVIDAVWSFEAYRAWAYYQLDLRPQFISRAPANIQTADAAATELARCTGEIASMVRGWMFGEEWLDDCLQQQLATFEAARDRLYHLVHAPGEDQLWEATSSRLAAAAAIAQPMFSARIPPPGFSLPSCDRGRGRGA